MPRSAGAATAAVVAALLLSGCSGDDEQSVARPAPTSTFTAEVPVLVPGAPGEAGEVVAPGDSRTVPNADEFGDGDVTFMTDMVVHHAQALRMAELAPERVGDARVRALAERISASQGPEISAMSAWLEARGLPVPDTGPESHAAHGDMPGMATPGELTLLAAAQGAEFDRRFLELMTRHHEGALQMVDEASTAAQHPQVVEVVSDTGIGQAVEIRRMQELLADLA